MRTYSEVDHDENPLEQDEGQGQRRLLHHSVGQIILSLVAMVTGSASIIMMANNRTFPALTLSPVALGLLGLTTAILGLTMSKKRSTKEQTNNRNSGLTTAILGLTMSKKRSTKEQTNNRNSMFIHYLLNVLTATLACVGTVYSCICGAICSGMRMYTSRGTSDVIQFCEPSTELSSVFAFVNGGICFVVGLWTMRGVCFSCNYGSSCGLNAATV